jgi:hypothetical protein
VSLIKITGIWIGLILLTSLAIIVSLLNLDHHYLLVIVASITIVKGMMVADVFMDLRSAPQIWHRLMTSYVVLVPVFIFLIYFLSAY